MGSLSQGTPSSRSNTVHRRVTSCLSHSEDLREPKSEDFREVWGVWISVWLVFGLEGKPMELWLMEEAAGFRVQEKGLWLRKVPGEEEEFAGVAGPRSPAQCEAGR